MIQLMTQDFTQIYRIDFNKIFLSTVRRELLRIFLAISYFVKLIIEQIDIVGAYLESLLSNNNLPIFMKLPLDFKSFKLV